MKEMAIEEIQKVDLEILKHIDSFCREHHIQYFLDSGTLIGAARHKGFIPWDDDMDIRMPRPDYERFISEFVDTPIFKLYAPVKRNSFLSYARVCEMKKTYFKQHTPWTFESPGVGVDILPLDAAPDDGEEFAKMAKLANRIIANIFKDRGALIHRQNFRKDIYGFLKDVVHFLASKMRKFGFDFFIWEHINQLENLRKKYPYGSTMHCFSCVLRMSQKGYWLQEWFSDVIYLDFCGEKFPAPIGYDELLSAEYGDWRSPPPENERDGHNRFQTMCWRDK